MKYAVLRIQGLTTVYLHGKDGGFQWSEDHEGRHEFDSEEDAVQAINQVGGRGIVAPIDPPAEPRHRPHPHPAPVPEHHAPPQSADWLTKWERDHES